ncbi:siderophore-interacting protein [Nonomuraea sp. CA-218870]|uniref:siderophore-interacting protein n=1 Tax=Nonomuraea sp. CA-218870 TaxID=3239998 RepID=UPI003D89B344
MIEPFRMFGVRVGRLDRLSPSFLRVTFTGDDLRHFADNGFDQRVKLILPVPSHGLSRLPQGSDWYGQWRAMPDQDRNPMRTYTVRRARPEARELEVDIVLHGDAGPMSRWACAAEVGDELVIIGPDGRYEGPPSGLEFRPPQGTGAVLIAGDETAAPAICSILERLPAGTTGEAFVEVATRGDFLPSETGSAVKVTWLARDGAPHGAHLVPAVREAALRLLPPLPAPEDFQDVDVDAAELWEVPEAPSGPLYAWLAGEAAVIRKLRRHLVAERGMDRRAVAFMGYWRLGRSEDWAA